MNLNLRPDDLNRVIKPRLDGVLRMRKLGVQFIGVRLFRGYEIGPRRNLPLSSVFFSEETLFLSTVSIDCCAHQG